MTSQKKKTNKIQGIEYLQNDGEKNLDNVKFHSKWKYNSKVKVTINRFSDKQETLTSPDLHWNKY